MSGYNREIEAITGDAEQRVELRRLHATDENGFVERLEELRDPMEDYCILSHQLEVGVSGSSEDPRDTNTTGVPPKLW